MDKLTISKVKLVSCAIDSSNFPKEYFPEYAFVGRSNVGKSSLINMILHYNIAKTSEKPGKTKTINFYLINEQWYLVDMPGIGYASVSKEIKKKWIELINTYLIKRRTLVYVFYLIDSRLPLQEIDSEVLLNFGKYKIPFVLISTKKDKATQKQLNLHNKTLYQFLKTYFEGNIIHIFTSIKTKEGRLELLKIIKNENENFFKLKIV